jgi:hypothetical protein
MTQRGTDRGSWPDLPYPAWRETCTTLHLWTQIVGKIRLSQTPWLNHSWQVPLYVTVRGLTTSPIPYGERAFQIDFDFIGHALRIETSDGPRWQMPLHAQPVADFHAAVMAALSDVGIEVHIDEIPNELPDPITAALIVARAAQGVGGALLVPGILAIIIAAHLTQYQLIGIIPSGGY